MAPPQTVPYSFAEPPLHDLLSERTQKAAQKISSPGNRCRFDISALLSKAGGSDAHEICDNSQPANPWVPLTGLRLFLDARQLKILPTSACRESFTFTIKRRPPRAPKGSLQNAVTSNLSCRHQFNLLHSGNLIKAEPFGYYRTAQPCWKGPLPLYFSHSALSNVARHGKFLGPMTLPSFILMAC